jgi:FkbM family methyltransferase
VPATYEKLCDNVRLNNLCRQVDCRKIGVGKEAGKLRFTKTQGPENRVLQSDIQGGGIDVPVTTLDNLIKEEDLTDEVLVVKVDVEGWEAAVIEGGTTVLSRTPPTALLLELDGSGEKYGFDDDAVHDDLLGKGYIPVAYDPHRCQISPRRQRQGDGNTLYVNNVDLFAQRVEESKTYSVLDKQV